MPQDTNHKRSPLAGAIGGAIIALACVALLGAGSSAPSQALAAPALPNAASQRLAMLKALDRIDDRLADLEQVLTDGELIVKVSEIPEVTIAE